MSSPKNLVDSGFEDGEDGEDFEDGDEDEDEDEEDDGGDGDDGDDGDGGDPTYPLPSDARTQESDSGAGGKRKKELHSEVREGRDGKRGGDTRLDISIKRTAEETSQTIEILALHLVCTLEFH